MSKKLKVCSKIISWYWMIPFYWYRFSLLRFYLRPPWSILGWNQNIPKYCQKCQKVYSVLKTIADWYLLSSVSNLFWLLPRQGQNMPKDGQQCPKKFITCLEISSWCHFIHWHSRVLSFQLIFFYLLWLSLSRVQTCLNMVKIAKRFIARHFRLLLISNIFYNKHCYLLLTHNFPESMYGQKCQSNSLCVQNSSDNAD